MLPRSLCLDRYLAHSKSVLLFGPRGVGKSQLLAELARGHIHHFMVDLLQSEVHLHYLTAPHLFRADVERRLGEAERLLVMVDEVQKLPGLLDEVHYLIERHRKQVQFVLTGSSARKLKSGGANLLAGRALTLEIKSDAQPARADLHGLLSFQSDYPDARLLCVCQTARPYRVDSIEVMPWPEFLDALFFRQSLLS